MLIIGTRGSDLALWQAHHVRELLRDRAGLAAEIHVISTEGDRVQDRRLEELATVGVFTKELESALLAREIDVAVHSCKDLPTASPTELTVAAIPARGSVRDCLVIRPEVLDPAGGLLPLREGVTVGTGSARRRAQLRHWRPDLRIGDLRGNVPTRIARLADPAPGGERLDAILVAEAGLVRLGLDPSPLVVHPLDPTRFVPAPAQGALAIQIRGDAPHPEGTGTLVAAIAALRDEAATRAVVAERLVLAGLEGGCNLPLGVHVASGEDGVENDGQDGGEDGGDAAEVTMHAFLGRKDRAAHQITVTAADPVTAAEAALARLRD